MISREWLRTRHRHRGRFGHDHIDRKRRTALILIVTALARVLIWSMLTLAYLAHLGFAVNLFKSVAFVALISMFALILTDWGQFAASMAQLSAEDVHADTEHTRAVLSGDVADVEADLAALAELQPGPAAQALAAEIRRKLGH